MIRKTNQKKLIIKGIKRKSSRIIFFFQFERNQSDRLRGRESISTGTM